MNEWDDIAETFGEAPDHGLRDPTVRAAWRTLLLDTLPRDARDIADLGCGTGTLSILLAREERDVVGIDSSPEMLRLAWKKSEALSEHRPSFVLGDAAEPALSRNAFDAVAARHIRFMLPEPGEVLLR